jgi:hypothetical protein
MVLQSITQTQTQTQSLSQKQQPHNGIQQNKLGSFLSHKVSSDIYGIDCKNVVKNIQSIKPPVHQLTTGGPG